MAKAIWDPERFANLNRLICEAIDAPDSLAQKFKKELTRALDDTKDYLATLYDLPGKNTSTRSKLEKG